MKSEDILHHVTVACKPTALVETTRGMIEYLQWITEEKARIEKKSGWPMAIYTNPKTGEVSLAQMRLKPKA